MAFDTPTHINAYRAELSEARADLAKAKGRVEAAGLALDTKLEELGLPAEFNLPKEKKAAPKAAPAKVVKKGKK